jgi:hypothetical protein
VEVTSEPKIATDTGSGIPQGSVSTWRFSVIIFLAVITIVVVQQAFS